MLQRAIKSIEKEISQDNQVKAIQLIFEKQKLLQKLQLGRRKQILDKKRINSISSVPGATSS